FFGIEGGGGLVPERARLARRTVVGRRLAHEVEPVDRARARGVVEVALAADAVRPLEPAAELAAAVVVEERRARLALRQRALFEPEHEDDIEAPRPRAQQVEHGDAPRLARGGRDLCAVERRDQLLARERAREALPLVELVEQAVGGCEAPEVE